MSNSQEIVAIIDDDPEIRAAMSRLVSGHGYSAQTFDSAETFLVGASTCRASCLLVDIELGDLSGVELARQLAADGFKFPVIFMSGSDDGTIESQAIAAGGIAFLRKPFPVEMLIGAIKRAVAANYSIRLIGRMPKSERRESARLRVFKGAKLVLGTSSLIDCVVRNMTNAGARIQIANTVELPEAFGLSFDGGYTVKPCRIVWRSVTEIGVEFL